MGALAEPLNDPARCKLRAGLQVGTTAQFGDLFVDLPPRRTNEKAASVGGWRLNRQTTSSSR